MKFNQKRIQELKDGEVIIDFSIDSNLLVLQLILTEAGIFKSKPAPQGTAKFYWIKNGGWMCDTLHNDPPIKSIVSIHYFIEDIEDWEPKNGEEVEVSNNGENWTRRTYIGRNHKSNWPVIVADYKGSVGAYMQIRLVINTVTRKEIAEKFNIPLEKLIIKD